MADRKPLTTIGGQIKELPATDRVAGHVASASVTHIVTLTQTAYDALTPPDPNTLYIITEE